MAEVQWDLLANLGNSFSNSYDKARTRQREDRKLALEEEDLAGDKIAAGYVADMLGRRTTTGGATGTPRRASSFAPGTGTTRAMAMPPEAFAPIIREAAAKHGVDEGLLTRTLSQESAFDPDVISGRRVSSAGAQGVAQFMPDTAKRFGINPLDPAQAIPAAAQYVAENRKLLGNDGLALAGYNWGEGNVQRWLASGGDPARVPAETRDYVQKITGKPIEVWARGGASASRSPAPATTASATTEPPPHVVDMADKIQEMLRYPNRRVRAQGLALAKDRLDGNYGFQVVGDQLVRTDKRTGTASAVGLGKQTRTLRLDEYAEHNIDPAYKGPIQIDHKGDLKYPAKAATEVNIGASEKEESKKIGEKAGERAAKTMEQMGAAQTGALEIARMQKLLTRIDTNAAQPIKMSLGAWGKALGVDEKLMTDLGIDPKQVGDAQAVQSLVGQMIVNRLGKGGFPSNNFSNKDLQFLQAIYPNIGNDPKANAIMMEVMARGYTLDMKKARSWQEFRKNNKGASFEDFEVQWLDQTKDVLADLYNQAPAAAAPQGGAGAPPPAGGLPPGARMAPDGFHYVPDPANPGKYLKVVQ